MSDTTKTEVRVIEGWARPGWFSPTGVKCLYDTNFKGEQVECSMVIGDKAVPMSTVMEMLNDIISTTQLATHGQFGLNITKGIAAKYGIKLP